MMMIGLLLLSLVLVLLLSFDDYDHKHGNENDVLVCCFFSFVSGWVGINMIYIIKYIRENLWKAK